MTFAYRSAPRCAHRLHPTDCSCYAAVWPARFFHRIITFDLGRCPLVKWVRPAPSPATAVSSKSFRLPSSNFTLFYHPLQPTRLTGVFTLAGRFWKMTLFSGMGVERWATRKSDPRTGNVLRHALKMCLHYLLQIITFKLDVQYTNYPLPHSFNIIIPH